MLDFLSLDGVCPCDTCPHADLCYTQRLACERYIRYTNNLHGGKREPSREIFESEERREVVEV